MSKYDEDDTELNDFNEEPKYTFMGRPPIYDSPEAMQNAIRDYFQRGITIRQEIVGKGKERRVVDIPVPTITGLVLWLGFDGRQSFYDYEKKEDFSYTIKRARTFIENIYEEILQTRGTPAAIFALKNFGWVDRTEQVISGNFEETRAKIRDFLDEDDDDDDTDSKSAELDTVRDDSQTTPAEENTQA